MGGTHTTDRLDFPLTLRLSCDNCRRLYGPEPRHAMPAKDLGIKHTCFKCSTKFYDLGKAAPVCPKCGADQRDGPALKGPPPERKRAPAPAAPRPAIEPELDVEEVEIEEDVDEPAEEEAPAAEDDEA
jgi:hypothetical protein